MVIFDIISSENHNILGRIFDQTNQNVPKKCLLRSNRELCSIYADTVSIVGCTFFEAISLDRFGIMAVVHHAYLSLNWKWHEFLKSVNRFSSLRQNHSALSSKVAAAAKKQRYCAPLWSFLTILCSKITIQFFSSASKEKNLKNSLKKSRTLFLKVNILYLLVLKV